MRGPVVLIVVLASIAGTILIIACIRVLWRLAGLYLIRKAGPRRLRLG